jgi:hypothetical protein
MKPVLIALVLLSFLSALGTVGCVPGLRSTKSNSPPEAVADAKEVPAASTKGQGVPKKELDRLLATPPPPDKLVPGHKRPLIKLSDLSGQEEVRKAALRFAQGLKNVKHVRVCYSKAYGGWFLLTYVPGGKKTVQQEYSWNKDTKEWELSGSQRAFPTKDLDSYLKSELPDEKCILLK